MVRKNPRRWPPCGVFRFSNTLEKWASIKSKTKWGMDHESEISSANHSCTSYRIDVSVVASRCRVLDDVPTRVNGNSKRIE